MPGGESLFPSPPLGPPGGGHRPAARKEYACHPSLSPDFPGEGGRRRWVRGPAGSDRLRKETAIQRVAFPGERAGIWIRPGSPRAFTGPSTLLVETPASRTQTTGRRGLLHLLGSRNRAGKRGPPWAWGPRARWSRFPCLPRHFPFGPPFPGDVSPPGPRPHLPGPSAVAARGIRPLHWPLPVPHPADGGHLRAFQHPGDGRLCLSWKVRVLFLRPLAHPCRKVHGVLFRRRASPLSSNPHSRKEWQDDPCFAVLMPVYGPLIGALFSR